MTLLGDELWATLGSDVLRPPGMYIILARPGGSGSGSVGGVIFCDSSQKKLRAIVGKCNPDIVTKYGVYGGMSCVPAGTVTAGNCDRW